MGVEVQLSQLCQEFIDVLQSFKEKIHITEEEFNIMAEKKVEFIEKHITQVRL